MKFLAAGGKIADIDRYLRRVEAALTPASDEVIKSRGEIRDLATLLRIEMAHPGVHRLEKRVHQAVRDREQALAKLDRAATTFEGHVTSTILAIIDAVDLLVDPDKPKKSEQVGKIPRVNFLRPRGRDDLLFMSRVLSVALEAATVESNPDLRRDAFVALHATESVRILRCLEALEQSRWRLSSPHQRHDLPGNFGVVKSGHFASYVALLTTATTAWRTENLTTLQHAMDVARDSFEAADARTRDMAGMSADLMNWLALRPGLHMQSLRPKAGERRRGLAETFKSQAVQPHPPTGSIVLQCGHLSVSTTGRMPTLDKHP